jgi:putative hydrolase
MGRRRPAGDQTTRNPRTMGAVSPPPDLPDDPFAAGDPDDEPDNNANPFAGMPLFGDLARMLSQQMGRQGAGSEADTARQFAINVATGGTTEANVDPVERIRIEELARVAELHVTQMTGLTVPTPGTGSVEAVTRTRWVERTLVDYRGLLASLSESLAQDPGDDDVDPNDPLAMLAPLMKMMGPMMVGMATGSMVGHLAQRSFGQYHLPIPRPAGQPVLLVPSNIDGFATDWSLPGDDVRLWVCIHELTHHAVLNVPHVRTRLDTMLSSYVSSFDPQSAAMGDRFDALDMDRMGDPEALAGLLGDPDVLLGAMRSPAQEALLPELEALIAVVVGYVDHIMDGIGSTLLGGYGQLTEALRRRRVEAGDADRFVERLLGLELTQAQYDRGRRFIDGVVERAGDQALARLWDDDRNLPTPAESDAPGLWLARIDLPDD